MFSAFFASILYLTANFVLGKYSLFIKGKFSLGAVVGTSLLLVLSLDLQANSENPPNNKVSLPLSNAPSVIKINRDFETRPIEAEASIYRTSERVDAQQAIMRYEQGLFTDEMYFTRHYDASPHYHWVYYSLENTTANPQKVYLEVRNAHINKLQLFDYAKDASINASMLTGDHFPFSKRPQNHRFFVFDNTLAPYETRHFLLYVDKYNEFVKFQLTLRSAANFQSSSMNEATGIGLMLGIYGVIILALSILWVFKFSFIRLFLFLYILGIATSVTAHSGLGMQYIWGNSPEFNVVARSIFSSFTIVVLLALTYYFLEMHRRENCKVKLLHISVTTAIFLIFLTIEFNHVTLGIESPLAKILSLSAFQTGLILLPIYLMLVSAFYMFTDYKLRYALFMLSCLGFFSPMFILSLTELGFQNDHFLTGLLVLGSLTIDFMIIAGVVIYDVYKVRREKKELAISLEKAVITGAENFLEGQQLERKRLALEVHDGASVRLAALQMRLSAEKKIESAAKTFLLNEVKDISQDLRNFSHNLSSVVLEDYGFVFAVEELILSLEECNGGYIFEFKYNSSNITSKTVERELYFICLELVNNAIKHSSGNKVAIDFVIDDQFYSLSVKDNGKGYETARNSVNGLGLKGIDWRLYILKGEFIRYFKEGFQTHLVKIPRA